MAIGGRERDGEASARRGRVNIQVHTYQQGCVFENFGRVDTFYTF